MFLYGILTLDEVGDCGDLFIKLPAVCESTCMGKTDASMNIYYFCIYILYCMKICQKIIDEALTKFGL